MTSFAFILGVLPLVIAEGRGAEMRRTLGTAVFAGMIGVTLFGIFLNAGLLLGWCAAAHRRNRRTNPRSAPTPRDAARGPVGPVAQRPGRATMQALPVG